MFKAKGNRSCFSGLAAPGTMIQAWGFRLNFVYASATAVKQAIRFSLGKYNTGEEVDFVIDQVRKTLKQTGREYEKLKSDIPVY